MNIISVNSFSKRFGDRSAVQDLSFAVAAGQTVGFIGRNGAGKTTTIRAILGLLLPTSGEILVFGRQAHGMAAEIRQRIGVVLDAPALYDDLTVRQNLELYCRLQNLDCIPDRIARAVGFADLEARKDDPARVLSRGMKQKAALGRALLSDPELIILDEPTSGLDPVFQREMVRLLRQLSASGTTVFLSSHSLAEVQDICHSVVMVHDGRLVANDTVQGLLTQFGTIRWKVSLRGQNLKQAAVDMIAATVPIVDARVVGESIELLLKPPGDERALAAAIGKLDSAATAQTMPPTLSDVFAVLADQ